jgi:orc1/cdc6 family replication initiation protein
VSIYGPPGTGKTTTTRRVCREFAARTDELAVEYVNLKECRSLFSAANEIHLALTGEKRGAYEGLDGVFDGIWSALEAYPAWTVLILDEIDHIQHDSNYDPSDFFYRLLRGEGKLTRDIQLSAWLLSNELLEVDLRIDSRVQSAMSGEDVFFPPYGTDELRAICEPRVAHGFRDGALADDVVAHGVREAAQRWGDACKALRLFRQAGETADEQRLDAVTTDCIDAALTTTEREAVIEKLQGLPLYHLGVLTAAVARRTGDGAIVQPVTTTQIHERLTASSTRATLQLGERRIREIVTDLATMGLVDTWVESRGRDGRVTQIETTRETAASRWAGPPLAERSRRRGHRATSPTGATRRPWRTRAAMAASGCWSGTTPSTSSESSSGTRKPTSARQTPRITAWTRYAMRVWASPVVASAGRSPRRGEWATPQRVGTANSGAGGERPPVRPRRVAVAVPAASRVR